MIPLIQHARQSAQQNSGRDAVVEPGGQTASYRDLLRGSAHTAEALLRACAAADLQQKPAAFLCPPSARYVQALWGIWRAGGTAVPLALSHPPPETEYIVQDVDPAALIASPEEAERLKTAAQKRGIPLIVLNNAWAGGASPERALPDIDPRRSAMILYTSGTAGKPKGVLSSHRGIEAQAQALLQAWEWSPNDRILHTLPLHHIHGVVNALVCPLRCGAVCEFLPKFSAEAVWKRLAEGGVTVFMGVPTIYARLAEAWEEAPPDAQADWSNAAANLRLAVSGSAALPATLFRRWRRIAGQPPLERYGMTEFGMALSNPYRGDRRAASVGYPLPGVQTQTAPDGELLVQSEGMFLRYWNRPDETEKAFRSGWFQTGDIVQQLPDGRFQILGRRSTDIIKTGGYKVSALEIEHALSELPQIRACAVVGALDPEWGERVCAAVVLCPNAELTLQQLREEAKQRLAPYKVPKQMLLMDDLPRNPMGKLVKRELKPLFQKSFQNRSQTPLQTHPPRET